MTNVLIFHCGQVNALIIQWILTEFQVSSVTKKQYHCQSYISSCYKNHHRSASKKRDIARLQAFRPKKVEIEEPSISDEIDMVVDESIPIAEIGAAELNRLKEETEKYRAELNKRNEEIHELRHQIEVLEKEKKIEKFNFMNLSEKNITFFCGIDIKTFK